LVDAERVLFHAGVDLFAGVAPAAAEVGPLAVFVLRHGGWSERFWDNAHTRSRLLEFFLGAG
jgi:hypothetical protein